MPHGDEMHTINLGTEEIKRELKVVNNGELESMVSLLKEFIHVFSWSYDDMLRLDTQTVTHKIPLIPGTISVKQKLRRMNLDMLFKVKDEVKK